MKPDRRNSEVFSLSFLDVICCSFGAMVLLVLLSKTEGVGGVLDVGKLRDLLAQVSAAKNDKTAATEKYKHLLTASQKLENKIAQTKLPNPKLSGLQQRLAESRAKARILQIQLGAIAGSESKTANTDGGLKVGGIPVDSDYVIFIIDTSGSMNLIWPRVITELENILDIHPKVKGFQIMNDMGTYLVSRYAGKWILDTPGRRKSVLSRMRIWRSFSNSSPVEGLETALKTYAKRTDKLAIYIFGDEYSGGPYGPVLDTISKLNSDPKTGKPLARIHGIGFFQNIEGIKRTQIRFATLMREVARQNRGAFVALKP